MLRAKGTIKKSCSVSKFEKDRLKRGDGIEGFAGRYNDFYRLRIHYEGGSGPPTAIVKLPKLGQEFYEKRVSRKKMRSFEIECKTYNRGAPFTKHRVA
jgi:hypothetical protein